MKLIQVLFVVQWKNINIHICFVENLLHQVRLTNWMGCDEHEHTSLNWRAYKWTNCNETGNLPPKKLLLLEGGTFVQRRTCRLCFTENRNFNHRGISTVVHISLKSCIRVHIDYNRLVKDIDIIFHFNLVRYV